MNNNYGQSPWSGPHPTASVPYAANKSNNNRLEGGDRGRDRALSFGDRSRRGYDTNGGSRNEPPSNFSRDQRDRRASRDGSPRDWGRGGGRWDQRENLENERERHHERRLDIGRDRILDSDRSGHCNKREGDSWKCMECGVINDPRDERCIRCRAWRSSSRSHPSSRDDPDRYQTRKHGRSFHDRRRDDKGSRDYYGPPPQAHHDRERRRDDYDIDDRYSRKKSRSSPKDDREPIQREWPPPFESAGASYIFDARSGFFYEPASNFFYDPKTKLYYSNKKQQYFQFSMDADPPFTPIANQAKQGQDAGITKSEANASSPTMPSPSNEVVPEAPSPDNDPTGTDKSDQRADKGDPKSKIAICLKTTILSQKNLDSKSLNKVATSVKDKLKDHQNPRKESSSPPNAPTMSQSHKQHEKDMDKWSERVKEMKSEENANVTVESSRPKPTAPKTVTTASGQPICVLCKRKFANLDKLHQHEKLSALHKANLAKKAAAESNLGSKQDDVPESNYRDRSKERRMLYGDVGAHAASGESHADALLAQVEETSLKNGDTKALPIRPEENLGSSNVGNKLLQKLGWKDGDMLGRKLDNGGGPSCDLQKGRNVVANSLKSDWERIESLAQSGGCIR